MAELESTAATYLDAYVRRGDFSRWIADVLGDHPLTAELRALEARHHTAARAETMAEIVGAIRARYEFADDESPGPIR